MGGQLPLRITQFPNSIFHPLHSHVHQIIPLPGPYSQSELWHLMPFYVRNRKDTREAHGYNNNNGQQQQLMFTFFSSNPQRWKSFFSSLYNDISSHSVLNVFWQLLERASRADHRFWKADFVLRAMPLHLDCCWLLLFFLTLCRSLWGMMRWI